tara:strand:- start:1010 stop:2566 length:1557 start_codon:yes stop_codon:yes gene_type:complete
VSKTILEKALLEAEQLEDTMRSNAKEILSSTMKEEIHELVKESLSENDYLKEQEDEQEVDFDLDVDDIEDTEEVLDVVPLDDVEADLELGIEDDTADEVALELPPLDLTLASDAEVLKVFKAMGDEDGIIIQQNDDEIDLTDNNTDTEYLIKLEQSKKEKVMKEQEGIKPKDVEEGMPEDEVTDPSLDEVVYEIELGEDEEYGGNKGDESKSRRDYTEDQEYGGNKGDESRSKRDYTEEAKYGGNKDDESRSRRDYAEGTYGGNKGDESRSRRDYSEGTYGGNKGDESKSRRDYSEGKYGGNKGDESRSRRDYSEGEYGGNKGDESRSKRDYNEMEGEIEETSRLKAGPNSSFSRMAGQKAWGKKRESRKSRKTNLGESRLRKSYNLLKEEVESLKTKNGEYKKALVTFKDKLNEVSVFNSNLAYVTRLFTEHSTTKTEKINILKRFDNVASLKDSKGLYKVIKEEFSQTTKKSNTISEAVERKITKSSTKGSGGKLLESKVYENEQFSRMKDLMSKL